MQTNEKDPKFEAEVGISRAALLLVVWLGQGGFCAAQMVLLLAVKICRSGGGRRRRHLAAVDQESWQKSCMYRCRR